MAAPPFLSPILNGLKRFEMADRRDYLDASALYGNQSVRETFASMLDSGRVSHAFLLYGEVGLGKKTWAAWFAAALVSQGEPELLEKGKWVNPYAHPDILWVEHSGKLQGISAETLRNLCGDAYLAPNDSDRKVYLLADCDHFDKRVQNILLKLVEEPPEFAYFIFTASRRDVFLPTILSRVVSLGMTEVSQEECAQALRKLGPAALGEDKCGEAQILSAVEAFGGNIGNCLAYLEGGELAKAVQLTKNAANGMMNASEYDLLKALASLEGNRSLAEQVLVLLDKLLRDACASQLGKGPGELRPLGCDREAAYRLGERYSLRRLGAVHELLNQSRRHLDSNVSWSLEAAALCGGIMDSLTGAHISRNHSGEKGIR